MTTCSCTLAVLCVTGLRRGVVAAWNFTTLLAERVAKTLRAAQIGFVSAGDATMHYMLKDYVDTQTSRRGRSSPQRKRKTATLTRNCSRRCGTARRCRMNSAQYRMSS